MQMLLRPGDAIVTRTSLALYAAMALAKGCASPALVHRLMVDVAHARPPEKKKKC